MEHNIFVYHLYNGNGKVLTIISIIVQIWKY